MTAVDNLKMNGLNISPSDTPTPRAAARCPATGAVADNDEAPVCPVTGKTTSVEPDMQEIDTELLRTSITARMSYLKDFLGFRRYDQDVLNKVAPLIYDVIPETVDRLYSKLFEFDVTKQVRLECSRWMRGADHLIGLPRTQ